MITKTQEVATAFILETSVSAKERVKSFDNANIGDRLMKPSSEKNEEYSGSN